LADEFVASYPDTLPRRLEWLSNNLRIGRQRFLRLMGLAPDDIEEHLGVPWEAIAERWPDEARWVEELLRQLIAPFSYDWKALAERLRQLAEDAAHQQPQGLSRAAGYVGRLGAVPPAERQQILLTLIAQGGPDVLGWLLEYLTQPATDGVAPAGKD
jgi:hypothetical protein